MIRKHSTCKKKHAEHDVNNNYYELFNKFSSKCCMTVSFLLYNKFSSLNLVRREENDAMV